MFSVAIYGRNVGFSFINDDFSRLNLLLRFSDMELSEALAEIFTDHFHAYFRPFSDLLLFGLYRSVGLEPGFYYGTSVALHFATGMV